jgi:hypothetical protein
VARHQSEVHSHDFQQNTVRLFDPSEDEKTEVVKRIIINAPSGESDSITVHQLRNVGEDVYKRFHFDGIAEVADMDTAVTSLHIDVKATRHLGVVMTFLKKSLRNHGIAEKVEIVRHVVIVGWLFPFIHQSL